MEPGKLTYEEKSAVITVERSFTGEKSRKALIMELLKKRCGDGKYEYKKL